ncbi:MAG: hypothetical protein PF574_01695 [Candidatus Delongbacteria bacterium]|jgi:hypothetical protein|nr:hypothetical protein [Candidatus Delongbacteria bacterium]
MKSEIEKLTNEISKNTVFIEKNIDDQKSLLNTHKWCEKKYESRNSDLLATEAGINIDQNKMTNKYLSNYAHCMSFAMEQIDFSYKNKKIDVFIKLVEKQTTIYLALTIDLFSKINSVIFDLISKEEYFQQLVVEYKEMISVDLKDVNI